MTTVKTFLKTFPIVLHFEGYDRPDWTVTYRDWESMDPGMTRQRLGDVPAVWVEDPDGDFRAASGRTDWVLLAMHDDEATLRHGDTLVTLFAQEVEV